MADNPYTYSPVTFEVGDPPSNDQLSQLSENGRFIHFVLSQFIADLDMPPDDFADLMSGLVLQKGLKVALSDTETWTFKPVKASDIGTEFDAILIKKADIDFDDLNTLADADRMIILREPGPIF